jgi:hypothetical protein
LGKRSSNHLVLLLLVLFAFPVPLVLEIEIELRHDVLVLVPVFVVVHAANTLVGLYDSMAVIKSRHMLKDKILNAVRFKIIMKLIRKLYKKIILKSSISCLTCDMRMTYKWRFTLLAFTGTIATRFVSVLSYVTITYFYVNIFPSIFS